MNAERIREVLTMIEADCIMDAGKLEGAPFTGRVVAEQFGGMLAVDQALATACRELLTAVGTLQDEQAELRDELNKLAAKLVAEDYLRAVKAGSWAVGTQTVGSGAAASGESHSVKA